MLTCWVRSRWLQGRRKTEVVIKVRASRKANRHHRQYLPLIPACKISNLTASSRDRRPCGGQPALGIYLRRSLFPCYVRSQLLRRRIRHCLKVRGLQLPSRVSFVHPYMTISHIDRFSSDMVDPELDSIESHLSCPEFSCIIHEITQMLASGVNSEDDLTVRQLQSSRILSNET